MNKRRIKIILNINEIVWFLNDQQSTAFVQKNTEKLIKNNINRRLLLRSGTGSLTENHSVTYTRQFHQLIRVC